MFLKGVFYLARRKSLLTDEEIIKLYQEGVTTGEISKLAGITPRAVRDCLYKNGIKLRSVGKPRQYQVNENFFKEWSNEMAWVLGFIYADGCISNTNQNVSISQKDKDLLDKIQKVMDSNFRYHYNKKTKVYMLTINSKEIKNDLMKFGLHNNKSKTIEFPDIPKEYLHHFVRGIIDGDGWVQDRGYVMIVTTGSKKFAESLCNVFKSWGLNSFIKENSNAYRVWVSGKDHMIKLYQILYKDCGDLYIDYKRQRMSIHLKNIISAK
jgi:DNA-binding transcriptional regulator WhiA/predicted HTH domain antitoxin